MSVYRTIGPLVSILTASFRGIMPSMVEPLSFSFKVFTVRIVGVRKLRNIAVI